MNSSVKRKQEYHVSVYGLFDGAARIEVGNRVIQAPLWVMGEWTGGLRKLMRDYGLGDSTARPCEEEALNNIASEARNIYSYYLKGYDKSLSRLHLDAIQFERYQMIEAEARFLLGKSKYEWIAQKLNHKHSLNYTWQQTRALLEEAEEAAVAAMDRLAQKESVKLLKRLEQATADLAAAPFQLVS